MIKGMTKNVYKPLLRFGEKQFFIQLQAPIGNLSTEGFLILCDEIAQFSLGEDVFLPPIKKERLDQFIEAITEEPVKKKAIYFNYLAFAHLRFFKKSIWQFLQENNALPFPRDNDKERLYKELIIYLQPQLQLLTNTFEYLYEQTNINYSRVFGMDFGRMFGLLFGSHFGFGIGISFGRALGRAFDCVVGNASDQAFRFSAGLAFGSEFGSIFGSSYGPIFGNHILTTEWLWLIWIGYYEKHIPKSITSMYFQSFPAFYFHYYIEEAKTVFDFIYWPELSVLYENLDDFCGVFPFSDHLSINGIKLQKNKLFCSLIVDDSTKKTIDEYEKGSLASYYRQLRDNQRSLFCPTSYLNLGMENFEMPIHNNKEIAFNRNLYIILPRTVEESDFYDFITPNKQKPIAEIVGAVMQAEDTVNIIKYTYLHRQDKHVTHDEIWEEYRRFLTDFVAARLKVGQDASPETIESI